MFKNTVYLDCTAQDTDCTVGFIYFFKLYFVAVNLVPLHKVYNDEGVFSEILQICWTSLVN